MANSGVTEDSANTGISLIGLVRILVQHMRLLIWAPLLVGVVTAVIVLLVPSVYESGAALAPASDNKSSILGSLSDVAGQFGIPIGQDVTKSPEFFADVLRSRWVLEKVLFTKIPDPGNAQDSIRVLDLYRVHAATPELLRDEGVKALYRRITVSVDRRTNIIRYSVEAPTPQSAQEVAQLLLAGLNEFNLTVRQGTARLRRQFLQGRVKSSGDSLRLAEAALRDFYEANRSIVSPSLHYQEQQLTRQVSIQQDIYIGLRRSYEAARLDEVNDTPALTIVEAPEVPGRRARPQRTITVLALMVVAFLLTAFSLVLAEAHRRLLASGDPDYQEIWAAAAATRDRIRRRPAL